MPNRINQKRTAPRHFAIKVVKGSRDFPSGAVVENSLANAEYARDAGSVPGLGRSPGGGHGNPLQFSCLENSMDRGAWQATVHRVTKSGTWLK